MTGTRRRPWLAAVLAVFVPGLGHVYLRSWARALGWLWVVILSVVLFVPEQLVTCADSFYGTLALSSAFPREAQFAVVGAIALSAGDAYRQAGRTNGRAVGRRCPHCGHELEGGAELDFCHWCTEPLPDDGDTGAGTDGE